MSQPRKKQSKDQLKTEGLSIAFKLKTLALRLEALQHGAIAIQTSSNVDSEEVIALTLANVSQDLSRRVRIAAGKDY